MPPKGWRKNAEGQFPQPNKDQGYVSVDEILFPASTVQKLAKKIINTYEEGEKESNMLLAKDSSVALQRSATVFVSHLMFHARQISKENSRKTVNAQDILQSLERAEFGGFVSEVKQKLSSFEAAVEQKKKQKLAGAKSDSEEQLVKRLKDNDNNVVQHLSESSKDDIEIEELGNNDDTGDVTATEELNEEANESMEADEIEQQADNPIAALEKEERELGGSEEENEENNEENSSDDDEN